MKNIKLKFLRALSLLLASLFIINPFGTPIYAATSEVTEQPQKIIENNTDGDNIITNGDVGPLSSHDPVSFNHFEIEKLTEYAIGGVCALASFAAISLAVLLPSSPDKFFNDFLDDHSDPNSLYIKMGGNQKYIEEYKQFLNTHSKQVEETYKVFNSSLCGATSLDKRELNVISCLRNHFLCNKLTKDQKKSIIHVVYCWLNLPGPKPDKFDGQDIFILFPVYEKFISQTKKFDRNDEAKVCYIFSQFTVASEKYKAKLRSHGRSSYFASPTFWPEVPECDRVYPDKLIDQYINDPLTSPVSADEWFTRLGGTPRYIERYTKAKSNLPTNDEAFNQYLNGCVDEKQYPKATNSNDEQLLASYVLINKDLPRAFINGKSLAADSIHIKAIAPACTNQIKRILYIYYTSFAPDYTKYNYHQGDLDIFKVIYSKFSKSTDFSIELDKDSEAKVCYIFSEFMQIKKTINDHTDDIDLESIENIITKEFVNNLYVSEDIDQWHKVYCNVSSNENMADNLRGQFLTRMLHTWDLLGLRYFGNDDITTKIFDRIIMDKNMFSEIYLNYNKVLFTIVRLSLSLFLEKSKSVNINNEECLLKLITDIH